MLLNFARIAFSVARIREDGGLLELWLSLRNRPSNSSTRELNICTIANNSSTWSNSATISASFCATLSVDRSGRAFMT